MDYTADWQPRAHSHEGNHFVDTLSPTYAPSLRASSLSSSFQNIRPTQFQKGRLHLDIPRDLSPGLEQVASQVGSIVKKDLQPDIGPPSHVLVCTEFPQLVGNCGRRYLNMLKSRGNRLYELAQTETHDFLEIAKQESDRLSKLIRTHKTCQRQLKRSQDEAGKRCVTV
jgi:hypothetical protein